MRTSVVVKGADYYLDAVVDGQTFRNKGHTFIPVHLMMMLQVAKEFGGLDPRTLTAHQIRFFFEGIRGQLREATKPR